MVETFDLFDVDDAVEAADAAAEQPRMDVEQWAEEQLNRAIAKTHGEVEPLESNNGGSVPFDIETGPRPLVEIEQFYEPPAKLGEFDPAGVKCGNLGAAKAAEKIEKARADHAAALANETAAAAAHQAAWLDKAALSPVTGRVLLIGMLLGDKPWFIDGPDEAKNLAAFWAFVEETLANKKAMIGHNSNGFDLPFLVRRSWALGVSVPREVRQGRYWNPLFQDTMEHWNCGAREYVSLNTLGQFFGVGQKTEGVEGGDFAKLWFGEMEAEKWGTPAEQRAKAIEYNGRDLELTAAIAAKMGMM